MAITLWRRLRQANTFPRYSPNDLEKAFSEVSMQDAARGSSIPRNIVPFGLTRAQTGNHNMWKHRIEMHGNECPPRHPLPSPI
jgi:hypothetical protein